MEKHGDSQITLEMMNTLFTALSDKLVDKGYSMELVLCGGAVMLINGARTMTGDIDNLRQIKAHYQLLIEEISKAYKDDGIENDWLNDDSYEPVPRGLPYVKYKDYPNLSVSMLTDEGMLVSKVAASRERDYNDIGFWIDRLGIKERSQVESLCVKYNVPLTHEDAERELAERFSGLDDEWDDDMDELNKKACDKVNMRLRALTHFFSTTTITETAY